MKLELCLQLWRSLSLRFPRWRLHLTLILLLGLVTALDNWLPHALISHHNRGVNPNPEILAQSGLEPELVEIEGDSALVTLRGWWLRAEDLESSEPSPTLIFLHSLGGTREDLLEFALPFREAGFDLMLLDLRSHGESDGEFFTYGARESEDISAAIDWLSEQGAAAHVGIIGVSAGGAVAIAAAAQDERIQAVVTLGTFADLEATITQQTPHLPGFWRERAVTQAEAIAEFEIEAASPVYSAAQLEVPLLILHGDRDQYIPPENARQLYDAAAGARQIGWITDGTHANMLQKEETQAQILNWLESAF